eukprot:CAMPEP_0119268828 /NCGR_PEP_ID=MMETSP1329-20130426/6470_1 /TAXON_ID=114041 /ORGANISM="Genus nov. species nov., Strain RCC1024" /LENGTH=315 /DNA_ID=CAMNT_0007268811 /DNA_START=237 /DNA_END=1181 /DNA_ORIENTATION=+
MARCASLLLVVGAVRGLTLLESSKLRSSCEARAVFAKEVARKVPDDLELAIAVAAEERAPEESVDDVSLRVYAGLHELAGRATTRARLESLMSGGGGDSGGARAVARAVGAAMYGERGLPEESGTDVEFFAGDVDDYYNPSNSFVDDVIKRRRGIPLTMSLIYERLCGAAGQPFEMVNTPGHVLVCPADENEEDRFVVDAFGGGAILDNARDQLEGVAPLTGLNFAARLLRNLRLIYERSETDETARLLGVAERMLLVAEHDASYEAVPPIERVHCHTAVGLCLYKLKDEDRREECRQRLQAARQWAGESSAGGE